LFGGPLENYVKPSITLIGAGAVGTSLALALHEHDYPIRTIVSRTEATARKLAKRVHAESCAPPGALLMPADGIVFIAVPDDELKGVATGLSAAVQGATTAVVMHTSGALPSEILGELRAAGASIGSFHPLMLFPRGRSTGTEFTHCPVAIEGDERALAAARTIARTLKAKAFLVPPEKKSLYHIAAVFASNYFVTLLSAVERTGAALDLPRDEIIPLFLPLIRQTLDAVVASSPRAALTGPIKRNDRDTIRRHLDALRDHGDTTMLSLYIELGLATAQLAKEEE
jgi:predicted short-subunit dehydrogenase-like oxidoreductase (DUF2520 family)